MSKRNPKRPSSPPADEPKEPSAKAARRARKDAALEQEQARSPLPRKWLVGAAGLVVAAVLAFLVFTRPQEEELPYGMGGVQYCAGDSQFLPLFGFNQGGALDTRAKYVKGIAIHQLDSNGSIVRSYQHPSWKTAGYMGAFQRDVSGNVYLISVPFISTLDNPPEKSNILYRIDTQTGVMSPLATLPALAPANAENSYGLMDLTYDCDSHSLYVSSVYGSSYDTVAGAIFQVDPATGAVKTALEGVDAFGVGVFNSVNGKRLYFGMARTPEVYSVGLDENGGFMDDFRLELTLDNLGVHPQEHAQSITFQGEGQLLVKTTQFDFNLVAPTETLQTLLMYNYSPALDSWQLVDSQRTSE